MSGPRVDGKGSAACSHIPEAHVVYEAPTGRYRAVLTCACRKVSVDSPKTRPTLVAANADARALTVLARGITA
ncbi:MAG TPA: hypothetical protein VN663_22765 [Ramlibacter sp.]|nr:hypothetical protein [Ramlibacter sp.]